jgi:predicted transcriptional regulator
MKKDPFLLVSLEESESKALAQVISNDTARKILDLLSKEESMTETDISKKLKVPLSTVHYNLQALSKANLIEAEEFHYSEKGKEVLHYKLANKIIIIAPKNTRTDSFKEKLKGLLPIGLISLGAAAIIQVVSMLKSSAFFIGSKVNEAPMLMMAKGVVDEAVNEAVPAAQEIVVRSVEEAIPEIASDGVQALGGAAYDSVANSAGSLADSASFAFNEPIGYVSQPSVALWFFLGCVFTIFILIIWYYFVTKKNLKE